MRKILFRAKRMDNEEWVYGDLIANVIHPYLINFKFAEDDVYEQCNYEVCPETIGQYTGLTDNNGKKIFEGDVVECVSWNEFFSLNGKPMESTRRKMEVVFHNGKFCMKEPLPAPLVDNYWDIIFNGDIEIVGNIYDK